MHISIVFVHGIFNMCWYPGMEIDRRTQSVEAPPYPLPLRSKMKIRGGTYNTNNIDMPPLDSHFNRRSNNPEITSTGGWCE